MSAREVLTRRRSSWSGPIMAMILCGVVALPLRVAHAQSTGSRSVAMSSLKGVVTDTLGNPLADIEVSLLKPRRQTRTRVDGSFRFDSLPSGTYEVYARSIGYVAAPSRVTIGRTSQSVQIQMIRLAYGLPSMISTAARGGLSGVIGDTAYQAMPNVKVSVIGTGSAVLTDSVGAFFVPLRPGQYMVRLDRSGFRRQLVSVTIPENEGRRVAAWMVPLSGSENPFEAHALFEMDQRLIREKGVSTRLFSREALETSGERTLEGLARRMAMGQIRDDCLVKVNEQYDVPLWSLSTSELEFLEVYLPSGRQSSPQTSLGGHPTKFTTSTTMRPRSSPVCGNLALRAWTRR